MANRFLNNITINDEYTLPSADGTADQIITTDGAGQLSFVDQSTIASGSTEVVEVPVKNLMGSDLKKGDPVYISGSVGASGRLEVKLADASDSNKMPAVGLLKQDLVNNEEGFVVVTGKLRNLITSPIDGATPNPNDVIYVKPNGTAGAALTLTKPTGSSNLIQNMGKVGRVSTSNDGTFIVSSILRSNDIPNLTTGKIWVGSNTNTTESTVVHLDETNGRMGIGTSSPTNALDVYGNIRLGTTGDFFIFQSPFVTNTFYARTVTSGTLTFGAPASFQQNVSVQGDFYAAGGSTSTAIGTKRFGTWSNRIVDTGNNYFNLQGGNFGIGTTNPQEKLHVQNYTTGESHQAMFKGGAVTVGDYSYVSLNNGYSTEYNKEVRLAAVSEQSNSNKTGFAILTSPDANGASGHERLRVTADGNVGIGTTSPTEKLVVNGSINSTSTSSNFTTGDKRFFADAYGLLNVARFGALSGSSTDPMSLAFYTSGSGSTGGSEKMRITSAGDVGIGTASPTRIGANITTLDIQGSSGGGLRFGTTGGVEGGLWTLGSGTTLASISNVPLYFRTNNNTKATILTNGNFGIGTTSPNAKLDVSGDVQFDNGDFNVLNSTGSYGGRSIARFRNGADQIQFGDVEGYISGNIFDINYGSSICNFVKMNVGIDNASPLYLLDVSGDGRVDGKFRCVTLIQTSQRDQKKDIYDIDKTKAKAIPFKEYKYKSSIDGSERKRYGVVAEDIENDYPELIHIGADGVKGINYIDLLVKRVAELEKELEDISLTPGPKGDKGATGAQGPAGANGANGKDGANGNDHLKNVQSITFNEKYGQLEIMIEGYKEPFRFNPAK